MKYQHSIDQVTDDTHSSSFVSHNMKRKSIRIRTKGIVALADFEEPLIAILYDITPDGVSFLYSNDRTLTSDKFTMNILLFDSLTNFEYCIDDVDGRVRFRRRVTAPKSTMPIWRFGVQFQNLDDNKLKLLEKGCSLTHNRYSTYWQALTNNIV